MIVRTRILIAAIAAAAALALVTAASADPTATVTSRFVLPDTRLADFQNNALPGSLTVNGDRGMLLGGLGSDLWHGPTDPLGVYWAVTDRGPNGEVPVDGVTRRTFPVPGFTPAIVRLQTTGAGTLSRQTIVPIVGQSGKPVTGLSNQETRDEKPFGWDAKLELQFNPSGLDTEGLVRTSAGDFWLVDEYSPSILKVDASGKVVARYVPQGLGLTGADYPVVESLPGIYLSRRGNRGFEGLALSKDETTVYAVLQSPLRVPNSATGDNSRNTRILALNTATGKPTGEWVYQFQPFAEFKATRAGDMKLSGVVVLEPNVLLVLERTDDVAKLFRFDLSKATNILGSVWDLPSTTPSLEGTTDLGAAGVAPGTKRLAIDLSTVAGMPGKIEGVTVLSATQIAVMNDNDFDINTFDANGVHQPKGSKTFLLELRLSEPLVAAPGAPNTGNSAPETATNRFQGTSGLVSLVAALIALATTLTFVHRRR